MHPRSVNTVKKVEFRTWSIRMRRLLLGTIVIILLAAAVAGLTRRLCERSGSDIDINRGDGRRCWEFVNVGDVVRASSFAMKCPGATGGPLGGEIGFRWQIANSVFGIAVNGSCANPEDAHANLVLPSLQDKRQIVTGSPVKDPLGYTWNDVLVHINGAAAVARNKYQLCELATPLPLVNGSESQWDGAARVEDLRSPFLPTKPSVLSTIACSWVLRSLVVAQPQSQAFPKGGPGEAAAVGQDINIGLVHVN
ncbi:outer membrane immunogenic protein [Bradyrhizobium brasilense]|uniref:Outer membrane immunogenic protein n=1 Tax=Bradyrhizobium brasilense TaxID=1419277 RepID=A0A1G7EYD9_9BRAD|nr:outer membrane immunogenic protein [Bradyrhizobium brasilense]